MADQMEHVSVNVEAAIAQRLHLEAEHIRERADTVDQEHRDLLAAAGNAADPNHRARIQRKADRLKAQRESLRGRATATARLARQAVLTADSLPNDTELGSLDPVTRTPLTKAEIEQREEESTTIAWERLRDDRDVALRASDWTQFADAPLDDKTKAAWAKYRAKLRDLPSSTSDPAKASWPKPPKGAP